MIAYSPPPEALELVLLRLSDARDVARCALVARAWAMAVAAAGKFEIYDIDVFFLVVL